MFAVRKQAPKEPDLRSSGFIFPGGTPCLQHSVADFFVSETQWC